MRNKNITIIFLLFFIPWMGIKAQTDTIFNQTDVKGLKQGCWKKNYPNGKLMYKGFFKDNKPVGIMRRYFESGNLMALMHYDSNGEYARAELYYEDGQIAAKGNYYNSQKDSTWEYFSYYDRSITNKENYIKGIRQGLEIHYYNTGEISEKTEWKNDMKNGKWEQYFKSKIQKLNGNYLNNKLNGEFRVNFDNGEPFITGGYANNQRDGKWTFYHEDGTVDMELNYTNGRTEDTVKLDEKQQEIFRMIDENEGKFEEPDETNFLAPPKK
jgi:antitoxin component YwqK of YwqJK toxin-antitoxin module